MSWTKYRTGAHAVATGQPINHGMFVSNAKPPRVSRTEMGRLLETHVSGSSARLEPYLHVSWEDGRECAQSRWDQQNSKGAAPVGTRMKTPSLEKPRKYDIACARVEDVDEEVLNLNVHHDEAKLPGFQSTNTDVRIGIKDKVLYRLPTGKSVQAIVIEVCEGDGEGYVLQTRPGGPLIRRALKEDISPWVENVNQRPKCKCGKHAAHKGKCFQSL